MDPACAGSTAREDISDSWLNACLDNGACIGNALQCVDRGIGDLATRKFVHPRAADFRPLLNG